MKLHNYVTKRNIFLLLLMLFVLFLFYVVLAQPYIIYRLSTKIFAGYEIYLLKYPNSHLVETESRWTTKITIATYYTYHTDNDIDTVLEYMEQQKPGFVHLHGSRVVIEPTYRQTIYADETAFRFIFQALGSFNPSIEIYIYPSNSGGTAIRISEHWVSKGWWKRVNYST